MKRCFGLLALGLGLVFTAAAQEEDSSGPATAASRFYEVISDSGAAAAERLSGELEGRFEGYNRFFRFDPSGMAGEPLRVRAFGDGEAYNEYVSQRLGTVVPGAVYLHYSEPYRRELVIHQGSAEADRVFPHQVFIQFFRAFIANPPAWMREGFALYCASLRWNAGDGTLVYVENLNWLEAVKKMRDDIPPVSSILLADIEGPPDHAELLSWALVSFLLDGNNEEYFRTLTECFMVLSPVESGSFNAQRVKDRIALWTDMDTLEREYRAYIASRKTFAELVLEGQDAYAARDREGAERVFKNALDQRRDHYAPWYYLGLLAYEAKDYDRAEEHYQAALQCGADPALTAYARGLNAISAGRIPAALNFLEAAALASPDRYRERVDQLSARFKR